MHRHRVVLGPRGELVTGNELTSFFPEDNEEDANSHGASTGAEGEPGEMVLQEEQQEFERVVYFLERADDLMDGEEWSLRSSAQEVAVLGIEIDNMAKGGRGEPDIKDSTPEDKGEVVKCEMTRGTDEIQEATKKSGTSLGIVDGAFDPGGGDGQSLFHASSSGDLIAADGKEQRSLVEGGELTLVTRGLDAHEKGEEGEEDSKKSELQSTNDGKSSAEENDEIKRVVDAEMQPSATVAHKDDDSGIARKGVEKFEGATSGPRGEQEPTRADIEIEDLEQEAQQAVLGLEAEGQAEATIEGQN